MARSVMLHLGQKIREGLPAAVVSRPEAIRIYVGGTLVEIDRIAGMP